MVVGLGSHIQGTMNVPDGWFREGGGVADSCKTSRATDVEHLYIILYISSYIYHISISSCTKSTRFT
jgi:hypothetical protein